MAPAPPPRRLVRLRLPTASATPVRWRSSCPSLLRALIALVGFASAFDDTAVADGIVRAIENVVPGLAGSALTEAVHQAQKVGAHNRFLPLTLGLIGTAITASTALGQIERATNRIYGIERDRPAHAKYGRAFVLALSVGFLFAVAFVTLAFGRDIGRQDGVMHSIWVVVRWPAGLAIAALALTGTPRYAPRRRQPSMSWLAFGSAVRRRLLDGGDALLRHRVQRELVVRPDVWAARRHRRAPARTLFSAVSILFGVAVAAQLEAVRAGLPQPAEPDPEEHPAPARAMTSAQPS